MSHNTRVMSRNARVMSHYHDARVTSHNARVMSHNAPVMSHRDKYESLAADEFFYTPRVNLKRVFNEMLPCRHTVTVVP